jgi:isoquinoline 1-oxidoreductase alpha subunit
MKVDFTVNGKPVSVDAPEDMPLLEVLRDVLNLRGTKYSCGMGECGVCTVHVAGRAQKSCQLKIATMAGQRVTTIEGRRPTARIRCSSRGRRSTPECGYCQPGQIMAAAALLGDAESH